MQYKTCTKCGETKMEDGFHPYSRNKTMRNAQCKACVNAKNRAYATTENGHERQRLAKRTYRLRTQYGLTTEAYDQLLAAQNGACAICGGPPGHAKDHYVDHCHITGMVRGLLCMHCNSALGHVRDNTDTLQRMIDYLNVKR